ncbi:uncharacterized protein LOC119175917 isoform X3 [Rhipicephalus microplus]|uniref:uncharacterized protein LOC119175917 isoform X3 n=1 Tax=Rhipicephalus microplus TaxID=6941 RepID=UPI003F6B458A
MRKDASVITLFFRSPHPCFAMAPILCAVKGCDSKTGGDVSMHSFPNDPAVRQVWVDFVRRYSSCDWTPAKRSRICSLHFGPDCYRIGNHRYLLEFGIALPKKRYLEPEAVPTLYAASAQHRDATPALEPTCKRPCFEESRDTGTSCGSPYELPAVDETSQFSSPDSQVPHDGDDVIAEHVAASPEHTEKCNDLTQCRVPKASKATQTSAMTVMQDVGVQAVKTSAEIGTVAVGSGDGSVESWQW